MHGSADHRWAECLSRELRRSKAGAQGCAVGPWRRRAVWRLSLFPKTARPHEVGKAVVLMAASFDRFGKGATDGCVAWRASESEPRLLSLGRFTESLFPAPRPVPCG